MPGTQVNGTDSPTRSAHDRDIRGAVASVNQQHHLLVVLLAQPQRLRVYWSSVRSTYRINLQFCVIRPRSSESELSRTRSLPVSLFFFMKNQNENRVLSTGKHTGTSTDL